VTRTRPDAGPRAEVLAFAGCPNAQPTIELVERVILELGGNAELELVEVRDADEVEALRFLGSPSVRVDGRDVEPGADERTDFAFSCRVYRTESGYSGQPSKDWIRAALEA